MLAYAWRIVGSAFVRFSIIVGMLAVGYRKPAWFALGFAAATLIGALSGRAEEPNSLSLQEQSASSSQSQSLSEAVAPNDTHYAALDYDLHPIAHVPPSGIAGDHHVTYGTIVDPSVPDDLAISQEVPADYDPL